MAEEQKTLLIVEDDPGLQSQLKWVFEGFDIVQVENRRDAIDAIRRHEPQVVLQDLGLPPDAEGVTEGLACVEEMLAIAPYTKIIVVTGHGDKDNALKAIRAGAYDFYQKPVDTDVLQLLVDRAHQLAMLEAENRRLQAPADRIVVDEGIELSLLVHVRRRHEEDLVACGLARAGREDQREQGDQWQPMPTHPGVRIRPAGRSAGCRERPRRSAPRVRPGSAP